MMRNPAETIGKMIDKAGISFISYTDSEGYPVTKKGVTDPDYCVLKFTAIKGRYYSNFKSEDFEI